MRAPATPAVSATLLTLTAFCAPAMAAAQADLDRPLRVFLDCTDFFCDESYFVQEIPWVDFVRDRQDADVHVLGTRQPTGGGGGAYTLEFLGRGVLDGQRLTLRQTTAADATEGIVRAALVQTVRLGLAPFAARTPASPRVEILPPEGVEEGAAMEAADPWNRWTFRLGVRAFMNGESQQRFLDTSGSASASRVTDEWKTTLGVSGSFFESEFELPDSTFVSRRESYNADALVVRSVGSRWALGGIASWIRSTFANYDTSIRVAPAIEYNVFPYEASTRKLLTALYGLGPRHNIYRDSTIFDETAETVIEQFLIVSYDVTQPWGSVDVATSATHYIAKFGDGRAWPDPQYHLALFGGFDVRLFRGLSANVFGNIQMVRGQIQLRAAGLTEEEILTRQRELATAYRYFLSFGLSYRFGSIFSDIVNPRFEMVEILN